MIMLQRLDEQSNENLGGLFIEPSHISALVPELRDITRIVLSNGHSYRTPFSVVEIIELMKQVHSR